MSRICIHQDDLITVWCDPERKLIHHEIHGYCHSEPFRAALGAGTDAMARHGCTAWLSDDRRNGPLTPEDAEWAINEWFPRTRAIGWTHWAVVKPERAVAQLNVQQFVDSYRERGLEVAVFDDPVVALQWLQTIEEA